MHPVVFAYGIDKFKPVRGCYGGVPIRRLINAIKEKRLCVQVDEYNTTKKCFMCKNPFVYTPKELGLKSRSAFVRRCAMYCPHGSHTMKLNHKDNLVSRRPIRGSSHCSVCHYTSPRDWNGAANITYILVMRVLEGVDRPVHLKRVPSNPSWRRQVRGDASRRN